MKEGKSYSKYTKLDALLLFPITLLDRFPIISDDYEYK